MISVHYEKPLWAEIGQNGDLKDIVAFSFVVDNEVGFRSCSITVKLPIPQLMFWVIYGTGHVIIVKNEADRVVWEGFVNVVENDFDELSITLTCEGFWKFLEYPYSNSDTGTYTRREKIIDVLSGEENSLFSTDYSNMIASSMSVYKNENQNRPGLTIIQELVAMGKDTDNTRLLFGIFEDRKAYLKESPTGVKYYSKRPKGFKVGPLSDIHNRVTVTYTDFLSKQQTNTSIGNNTTSQSNYGIWSKIVPSGEISSTNAEGIRDTLINERSNPETSKALSQGFQVTRLDETPINPWNIEPGYWLEFTGIPFGAIDETVQEDFSKLFIESVTYTYPYGLDITGNLVSTINQKLAKLGLGGI